MIDFTDEDIMDCESMAEIGKSDVAMYYLFLILADEDEDCLCDYGWRHCPVHQEK